MNFSINSKCPCGSNQKYKKCCGIFHKGANPKSALLLMKSRYCAYAISNTKYIIKTTHPNNESFRNDKKAWDNELKEYCRNEEFLGLTIIDSSEDMVEFKAELSSGVLYERSKFEKVDGVWLYESGNIK